MSSYKEECRQPSERLCGCELNMKSNDNRFSSQIHYKNFLLQLPPNEMNEDQKYEFMKRQIFEYLLPHEYDAAIKFICILLDY